MKVEIEPTDTQSIAEKVLELIKPYIVRNGNDGNDEERIMDKKELAAYLGVDLSWIDKNIHILPRFNVGKYVRFKRSKIDKWIDTISKTPSPMLSLVRKLK